MLQRDPVALVPLHVGQSNLFSGLLASLHFCQSAVRRPDAGGRPPGGIQRFRQIQAADLDPRLPPDVGAQSDPSVAHRNGIDSFARLLHAHPVPAVGYFPLAALGR